MHQLLSLSPKCIICQDYHDLPKISEADIKRSDLRHVISVIQSQSLSLSALLFPIRHSCRHLLKYFSSLVKVLRTHGGRNHLTKLDYSPKDLLDHGDTMTHPNFVTNGASLEDCHTNFFALVSTVYCSSHNLLKSEGEEPFQPQAFK